MFWIRQKDFSNRGLMVLEESLQSRGRKQMERKLLSSLKGVKKRVTCFKLDFHYKTINMSSMQKRGFLTVMFLEKVDIRLRSFNIYIYIYNFLSR